MGRPVTVSVGPLAAASATKVAASQKAAGAQFLVLNGGGGTAVANNICLSQSAAGAAALLLNGSLASGSPAVATIAQNLPIYITSAGNDSGITFAIVGLAYNAGGGPFSVTETIAGSNASVASSVNSYYSILSITTSGATASTVTVGTYAPVKLDTARQILITPAGTDTNTYTLSGTDWAGNPISEVIAGVTNPSTAVSALSYLSVVGIKTSAAIGSTVTIGTNGVAYSPWVRFDTYGSHAQVAIQATTSGTVSGTVQQTLQDPNSPTDPVTPDKMAWVNHPDTNLVNFSSTVQGNYAYTPLFARVLLNSETGTGSISTVFSQTYQD